MSSVNTTTMATTTTTTDHENIFFLFLGGAIELLISLAAIPVSLVNLFLVARTSVIHPNMKAILIFQSFLILLRAFCRGVICLFKFILWDPIGAESMHFFPFLAIFNFIGIYGRNFVPHILIIERILATLLVRTYEQFRGYLFTVIWTPIALSENIRIGKQLIPPLLLHLLTIVTSTVIISWSYFQWPHYYQMYNLLSTLNAVTGFLIELFIITIADQTASTAANFDNRIVAVSNKNTAALGIAQRDLISGKALIIDQPKADEHFAMLLQAGSWSFRQWTFRQWTFRHRTFRQKDFSTAKDISIAKDFSTGVILSSDEVADSYCVAYQEIGPASACHFNRHCRRVILIRHFEKNPDSNPTPDHNAMRKNGGDKKQSG
ncbi:hypothetical protein niasHT_036420 [Heterodera trifolii]|uniref:Uncharacterized protein n=1 Tax=Heterodera trifolii TaxID=157864 RepID=A0ABD2HTP1_9BILA